MKRFALVLLCAIIASTCFGGMSTPLNWDYIVGIPWWVLDGDNWYTNSSGENISDVNIGIGTNNPAYPLDIYGNSMRIMYGGANNTLLRIQNYSETTTKYPYLAFQKSHTNAIGTSQTTINGDILGSVLFYGFDTGDVLTASCSIRATQDGAADIEVPGKLDFYTSPSNSASAVRMTIKPDGAIDWVAGNVIQVPLGADIETAVTAATAGDTLVLAAGTYTITGDIDIAKAITIRGQGPEATIISYTATTDDYVFSATVSNVRIQNLSVTLTHGTSTTISGGILFDGSAGTVLSGCNVENCDITVSSTTARCRGIFYQDASGTVRDCVISSSLAPSGKTSYGIVLQNNSSAEAATTVRVYNVRAICSGSSADTAAGFYCNDNGSTQLGLLYLYNCQGFGTGTATTETGAYATGGDARVYVYGGTMDGDDYDVTQASSAVLYVIGSMLLNGTTSGTITYLGMIIGSDAYFDDDVTINDDATVNGVFTLKEQVAEPSDPADGYSVIWMSNGTGAGADGDIMIKRTIAGVVTTNSITLGAAAP